MPKWDEKGGMIQNSWIFNQLFSKFIEAYLHLGPVKARRRSGEAWSELKVWENGSCKGTRMRQNSELMYASVKTQGMYVIVENVKGHFSLIKK